MGKLINPALKDIWNSTQVIRITRGLNLGIFQYTYHVFLYDHFGGDVKALKSIIFLMILSALLMLIAEVPTGALADHIGRKKTLVLSLAIGTVSYFFRTWVYFANSFSFSFILALLAVVFYSLSFSLFKGSFTAWIVDAVRERNVPEGHGPILARSYGSLMLAKIIGGILGLSLYLSGYVYYAFGLGALSYLLCAIYCGGTMQESKSMEFHKGDFILKESLAKMKKIIADGVGISLKTPPIAYMILMNAAFMMLIQVVNYLWPVAMKSNFGIGKMSPYWFIVVFTSMGMALLGTKLLEKINHRHVDGKIRKLPDSTLWNWLAGACIIMAIPIIVLGINAGTNSMDLNLFIVAMAAFSIGYGFVIPAYEILINYFIPSNHAKERATIMSLSEMLLELCFVVLLFPSSGPSGKQTAVGWILPAGILIVLTVVVHFLMRRYQRRAGELATGGNLVPET